MFFSTKSMGSQAGSCESQVDGNQIIKWVILQSDCGNLIGRGGEGIKKINEVSGSWVKVAHLEDSVRGAKERLVYIRGTPEQNLIALQIIIEKVGGWPFTTPVYDHEIAKIEDKTTLYMPFLAIPMVLFEKTCFHSNLFPSRSDEYPVIAGATVMIDANFFTSSAETQIHLIGPLNARERAKEIVLERLRDWLGNHEHSDFTDLSHPHVPHSPASLKTSVFHNNVRSNFCDIKSFYDDIDNVGDVLDSKISSSYECINGTNNKPKCIIDLNEKICNSVNLSNVLIPRQFSAQFANQFADSEASTLLQLPLINSIVVSHDDPKLVPQRSQSSPGRDQIFNKVSLLRDVAQFQQEILDCCVKVIISQEFVPMFESLIPSLDNKQSICQHIHKITSCYVQILPSHNIVTKSFNVAKIAVIGGSLTKILSAIDMLLDFVHSLRGLCPYILLHRIVIS